MKERSIRTYAHEVRAILGGTQTQMRRAVKPQPPAVFCEGDVAAITNGTHWTISKLPDRKVWHPDPHPGILCPYGQPGDRLWVRETFADLRGTGIEHRPNPSGPIKRYAFAADHPPGSHGDEARKEFGVKWKPSIHMPRAASRITLEITGVRVERLQDISEADAIAEGVGLNASAIGVPTTGESPRPMAIALYQDLWESINGPDSWAANPWVWVVEFKRLEQPA
jgi:hypothetical protein